VTRAAPPAIPRQSKSRGWVCRLKREEERIAREMAEKDEEEARAVLEQAAKSGKIKLPTTGDKLDKEAILSQVPSWLSLYLTLILEELLVTRKEHRRI